MTKVKKEKKQKSKPVSILTKMGLKHDKTKTIGKVVSVKFDARKHYVGMPEFVQNDVAAYKKLTVNFKNDEDIRRFFKLINQSFTNKTRSIWFPDAGIDKLQDKRYASKKK